MMKRMTIKTTTYKIYATFYELKEDNFIRLTNIYKQKAILPPLFLSTINKTICSLIHLTKSKFTTTLDTVHFIYTINKSVKFYDY